LNFLQAKKLFEKGLEKLIAKDYESSIEFFESSLKIAKDRPSTLKNLVIAYIGINNLKKAEYYLKSLIINNEKEIDIIPLISKIFRQTDRIPEFINFIETIKDKKIDPIFLIQKDLSIPKIFNNKDEIKYFRKNFESNLDRNLQNDFSKKFNLEIEQLDPPIFPLSYDEYDNKENFKNVVKFLRKIYPQLNYSKKNFKKNETIKIGFISQFLNDHTIGKLFKGIILNLDYNNFEIQIFHSSQTKKDGIYKELIESEKILNIKNFSLPNKFSEGVKIIEKRNLDIMFYPDIGMSADLYYYSFLRLAKYQMTSWGHPETTGNSSIDYFLSSKLLETKSGHLNYTEKLLLSDYLPMYYYKPVLKNILDENQIASENIYSCPQSLIKIHPDFDEVLLKILKKDKKAKIYFIKDKRGYLYKKVLDRFIKNLGSYIDRVIFLENLSMNDYINHCGSASVLLDPYYFGSGNSFHESMYYGTPTVTKPTNYSKSRIATGAYKQMKIEKPPVVKTSEEYVEKAIEIANNKSKNLKIKKYYRDSAEKYLFENMKFIRDLENIFFEITN